MIKSIHYSVFAFCMASIFSLFCNNYVDTIMNDYKKNSLLAQEFNKAHVWELFKNDPKKAEQAALAVLRNFYADSIMGLYLDEQDYKDAWERIKEEWARIKTEQEEQYPIEQLHQLPPKRVIPSKKGQNNRVKALTKKGVNKQTKE